MILLAILLISFLQVVVYIILDKTRLRKAKALVLMLILSAHFFLLPTVFSPRLPEGIKCGMPILGVFLAFWIIGGLLTITTHVIYFFATRKKGAT